MKWHLVEPKTGGLSYRFRMLVTLEEMRDDRSPFSYLRETEAWCRDQFRDGKGLRNYNSSEMEFSDEREATAFRIRWC